jgi:CheY-like chemotaxis protein
VRVLFSNEFDLHIAPDAAGAMKCLHTAQIDLILMDLSLAGGTDGIELTKLIREDPESSEIPIIALTAHAFPKDRQNCLDAGCNDYIAKPFQRAHLLELIHTYLRNT